MNKVGDTSALMAGIDHTPSDPFATEFTYRQVWCVAPHGKILGWIKWDGPEVYRRAFHVYSHGRDDGGRVWVKSFETIGSAATFIRQHAADMSKLTARLQPDMCEIVDGAPVRRDASRCPPVTARYRSTQHGGRVDHLPGLGSAD